MTFIKSWGGLHPLVLMSPCPDLHYTEHGFTFQKGQGPRQLNSLQPVDVISELGALLDQLSIAKSILRWPGSFTANPNLIKS